MMAFRSSMSEVCSSMYVKPSEGAGVTAGPYVHEKKDDLKLLKLKNYERAFYY